MPDRPQNTADSPGTAGFRRIAIVGTGLIGASFGLALRRAGFAGEIVGVSSSGAIRDALALGAIDRGASLDEAAGWAELIYLAQPIDRILDTLGRLNAQVRPDALVTDAGSTKGVIASTAARHLTRAQFLGGHPLAGKEKSGAAQAEAGLFVDRTYVVTPRQPADLATPAAQELLNWIGRIGARVVVLTPERHDIVVAFTSHLAQLASTALAATVAASLESSADLEVSGPGLADMTRLASSPYDVWQPILETNSDAVDVALSAYIRRLESLRRNLSGTQMRQAFAAGASAAACVPRPVRRTE